MCQPSHHIVIFFIFLWWKEKAWGRQRAEAEKVNWYSEVVCMCKLGHGGMRPGIHYNAASNIMIQAHACWAVTAVCRGGGGPMDGRGWKGNVWTERESKQAVWGSNSSACSRRFIQSEPSAFILLSSSLLFSSFRKTEQSCRQMGWSNTAGRDWNLI